MDFLNKLYANENFGIGLFCVISFLVVLFLVVLFFGKRDEKKRKLEATNKINTVNNEEDLFKETTVEAPVEVPVLDPALNMEPVMPVEPISYEPTQIEQEETLNTNLEDNSFVENITLEEQPVDNLVSEPKATIPFDVEVTPISVIEDTIEDAPVIEPIKIEIPEDVSSSEVVNVPPVVEEVKPLISEVESPIMEDTVVSNETYYKPVEPVEAQVVDVPNIDFDAIAKSIAKELDELEHDNTTNDVVTPIEEVVSSKPEVSNLYTNEVVKPTVEAKTKIVLPKRIELPQTKKEEIEPESYQI